jgi:DNA-binding MarR family transcriptional regulator
VNYKKKGRKKLTEPTRFSKLALLIDGIHKSIHKMKLGAAPHLGVKAVHVLWIYELMNHDSGLTATELAANTMIDRSLVSREIEVLKKNGYVTTSETAGKRNYNTRIYLTEKGILLAEQITDRVKCIQDEVDKGISKEELESFYSTLEKLSGNFVKISKDFTF